MRTFAVVISFLGALAALSGFVFTLQGLGIVGPESSFMYLNPSWITYGSIVLVVGLVMIAIGYRFRSSQQIPVKPS